MREVIGVSHLSKTFPGQKALDDVSLSVRSGEVHALVGQNGSGKSTLIKALAGYHAPDPGATVTVLGEEVDVRDLRDPRLRRLRFIHQDLGLVGTLTAVENLSLTVGPSFALRRISFAKEERAARQWLAEFALDIDLHQPVDDLTRVERTVVAIVRALMEWDHPEGALILDEPTAALPLPEVRHLFDIVKRLTARGAGVMYVSHRLDEVLELADRVSVLRDGRLVTTQAASDIDHESLVRHIVGRTVDLSLAHQAPSAREVVLRIRDLAGERLREVSFDVYAGEIVGITGLLGSGREHLARTIFGADAQRSGSVEVDGHNLTSGSPHQAVRCGMALVPADRAREGLFPDSSVRENLTLPHLTPLVRRGRISRRREEAEADSWIERTRLSPPSRERMVASLSGGNQQKVVLGKWLRTNPKVLVLDEPTQGVDVAAKAAIYKLVGEAAEAGASVLVCSSEVEEMVEVCERILVLRDGRVCAELAGQSLTSDRVLAEMLIPASVGWDAEEAK